jgi:hypothetical protein
LSASAPSSHDLSSAAFTINIAESNFRHTQVDPLIKLRANATTIMIKNGLYKISTEFLDGVGITNVDIIVLHDGKLHGGGPYFYTVGSYTCSGRKWKGEATTQEHTPFHWKHPWAGKIVTWDLVGLIAMIALKSTPWPSWASKASGSNRFCSCWWRTESCHEGNLDRLG